MMTRRQTIKIAALASVTLATLLGASAQTSSATPVSTTAGGSAIPPNTELARKILADQTLREVHRMAQDLLKDGLNAGSNYRSVWYKRYNGDSLRIVALMDFKGSSLSNYAEPLFSLWQDTDWHWAANTYFLAATA